MTRLLRRWEKGSREKKNGVPIQRNSSLFLKKILRPAFIASLHENRFLNLP